MDVCIYYLYMCVYIISSIEIFVAFPTDAFPGLLSQWGGKSPFLAEDLVQQSHVCLAERVELIVR